MLIMASSFFISYFHKAYLNFAQTAFFTSLFNHQPSIRLCRNGNGYIRIVSPA